MNLRCAWKILLSSFWFVECFRDTLNSHFRDWTWTFRLFCVKFGRGERSVRLFSTQLFRKPSPPVTDRVCAKRFSLNFHDSERVAQQTNAFPIIRGFCAAKVGWSGYKTIHCWEISKTIVTCCFLGLALQAKVRFLDDFVRVVCKALLRMTEWLMVCVCV